MTTTTTDADRALKARHRAMWAIGDYPAVAREVVAGVGPVLVEACGVRRGDRVLDVAAGARGAAGPAAPPRGGGGGARPPPPPLRGRRTPAGGPAGAPRG